MNYSNLQHITWFHKIYTTMAESSLVLVKICISVSLILLCFPTHPLFQCTFTQMHVSHQKIYRKTNSALVYVCRNICINRMYYVRRHKCMVAFLFENPCTVVMSCLKTLPREYKYIYDERYKTHSRRELPV